MTLRTTSFRRRWFRAVTASLVVVAGVWCFLPLSKEETVLVILSLPKNPVVPGGKGIDSYDIGPQVILPDRSRLDAKIRVTEFPPRKRAAGPLTIWAQPWNTDFRFSPRRLVFSLLAGLGCFVAIYWVALFRSFVCSLRRQIALVHQFIFGSFQGG
jgi:hypothetical protein